MKKKVGILMNERKKITIEEFKKWKSDYQIFLNEMEKEADSNPNLTSDHIFLTKVATRLKKFQSDLLETDLSLIPSEDWKGIQWMSGTLNGIQLSGDFSNTHANIDFNYFDVDYSSGYNFDGCNVNPVSIYNNPPYYRWENIKSNDDAKRIFGSNYVKEHPEIFPPDDIPQNIQEDFYNKRLSIDACIQYPELFLSLESYNARSSTAYNLNDEWSKNDVNQYLNRYGISTFRSLYFNDRKTFDFITKYRILPNEEIADLNPTIPSQKKDILKRISNQIFDELLDLNRGLKITLSKEEIPAFFYDYYPEMKIEFNNKDLEEKYSSRTLSLKDVKENYELFKNVDYRYLLPNYKCLIKEFGGLESFLTSFPDEYYEWIDELSVIKDDTFFENHTFKTKEQYHSLNDIVKKIYYEIANCYSKLDAMDLYLKHGGDIKLLSKIPTASTLGTSLLKVIQWNHDNDGVLDKESMIQNLTCLSYLIEINNDINKELQDNFGLKINDDAFAPEHAVEIQVPVIQSVFKDVKIIPVLVGKSSPEMVEKIIKHYYPDKTNGFIISSDLSHFLKDEEAKKLDNLTAQMIESGACSGFRYEQACGAVGIIGLVEFARKNDFSLIRIDMTNSSAVTGDTSSVVGYGCWFLYEGKKNDFLKKYYSEFILNLCRLSINSRFDRREMKVRIPYVFYQPGACFVTLEKNNILRGCIGSIIAHRPLIEDLILNAKSAAFQDPRFKPVEIEEVLELDVAVSLLSEPQIMSFESEEDLLNQIVPFKDGIIIKDGNYQAVYLPSVWEQIPDKKGFLNSLKIKAGLPSNYFSKTFQAYRFETDYIK